jgi:hypothetical protein
MPRRKFTFPDPYDRTNETTIQLPRQLIPVIAGKLDELKYKSAWVTDADWQQAQQEIRYVQEKLIGT